MLQKTKLDLPHRTGKILLFLLLSLGIITFIFARSLQPGTESEQESGFFVWLLQLMGLGGSDTGWLEYLVRKTAHFVEYACLGGVLACFWRGVLLRYGWAGLLAGITGGGGGQRGRDHPAFGAGAHRAAFRCAAGHRRGSHRSGHGAFDFVAVGEKVAKPLNGNASAPPPPGLYDLRPASGQPINQLTPEPSLWLQGVLRQKTGLPIRKSRLVVMIPPRFASSPAPSAG